ncbi:GYDIA family GHMP kinase [uncultured Capnocytophaga sp.]|uniref:GYDIA family GHMP kinase n=1 Tax=uncultured Capnocytophaga sp. TaxID=159273 RepID=UPI002599243E|nr:GYDIA family GHMP kinase [uncultured Capnocytophaga sp.]
MGVTQTYSFHSNGKLLITGEYAVLDGALAFALPTQKGQTLKVIEGANENRWQAFDANGDLWFDSATLTTETDQQIAQTLQKILTTATLLNPNFKDKWLYSQVQTHLEFPRLWGLGTSSTLINNIAQWAAVNPYELLFKSFGGSGYDIACAKSNTPLLYKLKGGKPHSYPLRFLFPHTHQIYFVYLNQKQNSKDGIARYRSVTKSKRKLAESITRLTEQFVLAHTVTDVCQILNEHETLISNYLSMPTVKERLFSDFNGTVKSLGAWGGDFVLAISETEDTPAYFASKGFDTCVPYNEMI